MLDIGPKLREARRRNDLSLRELARKADVSASLLSQIENGKANPSVMSLYNIAAALSVPVDHFFPDPLRPEQEARAPSVAVVDRAPGELRFAPEKGDPFDGSNTQSERQPGRFADPIVRGDARASIELMGGVTWSRLTPGREVNAEFLEICYEVAASSGPAMSRHPGREFGMILEGELTLELGFERFQLCQGDSIVFDSTLPHRLSNEGASPMRAVWVIFDHRYSE